MAEAARLQFPLPEDLRMHTVDTDTMAEASHQPSVLEVAALPSDELARKRADRLMSRAGSLALEATGIKQPEVDTVTRYKNILEAAKAAARGDEIARKMVRENVRCDYFERMIKAGLVLKVELEEDSQTGEILQNGQTIEQIHVNTHFHKVENEKMTPRYRAETYNAMRLRSAKQEGLLGDYYFVVFSPCPDDMTEEELSEQNFFVPTMSMAVQATSIENLENQSKLTLESAFVAGRISSEVERHDLKMIERLGKKLGVDLSGASAVVLSKPLLVHKELMPNGVVDIVRMLDEMLDESEAPTTFFGQAVAREDYAAYRAKCAEREAEASYIVERITEEFIQAARILTDPVTATEKLNELSAKHMWDRAVEDERIDPAIFGNEASPILQAARTAHAEGDIQRVRVLTHAGLQVETSGSCPIRLRTGRGGRRLRARGLDPEQDLLDDILDEPEKPETSSIPNSIRCIKCRSYSAKEDVVKKDCWECPKCKYKVDICTGDVLSVGLNESEKKSVNAASEVVKLFAAIAELLKQQSSSEKAGMKDVETVSLFENVDVTELQPTAA